MAVGDITEREERPAMVRFEKRPIEDKQASREAGQIIYKDVDFVLVTPPYSKDLFEHKVTVWFDNVEKNVRSGRTHPEWRDYWHRCYENWKKGEETPLDGTSVKNWSAITPAQCKTLLTANILTIEALAMANDEGTRRLGMGGVDLKNKARAYVQAAKDTGPLVMENAALKKQVSQHEATIDNLSEKMEILGQRLEAMKGLPLAEVDKPIGHSIGITDILDESAAVYDVKPAALPEKTPAEQYEVKFGKKPHHLMKEATILKRLSE